MVTQRYTYLGHFARGRNHPTVPQESLHPLCSDIIQLVWHGKRKPLQMPSWCHLNGVQSSYSNDSETKVELERVVITVLSGTAPVP